MNFEDISDNIKVISFLILFIFVIIALVIALSVEHKFLLEDQKGDIIEVCKICDCNFGGCRASDCTIHKSFEGQNLRCVQLK